ncbi:MAG: translocation/assembly module TamB domain-containing protein [Bacteroidales bacterium]
MQVNPRKILKVSLKVLLYILGFLILVLAVVLVFIRTEKGQDTIRKEAVSYLTKTIGTPVSIGSFRTNLLTHIEIQGITIEDQSKEVLLHVGKINLNYQLFALLNNTLSVSKVDIDTLNFRMARNENDSAFNFNFIIQAFSGTPSQEINTDTSGSSMVIDIGTLNIKQLHYLMDDKKGQQFYDVKSNFIAVSAKKLDIVKQVYEISNFETEGVTANIDIGIDESVTPEEVSGGLLPQINIEKIALSNNSFVVQMAGSGYKSETQIQQFTANHFELNLNTNKLNLGNLLIDKHFSKVLIKTPETEATIIKTQETAPIESSPFTATIASISLIDNDLKYDSEKEAEKTIPTFDPEHIHFEQLQLQIDDFAFEGSAIQGTIQNLQGKEQSGLNIQQLSAAFHYADTGVILDKFIFKTPTSYIDGNFKVNYESIAAISKNPGQLGFDIDLKNLLLSSQDMMIFKTLAGNNPEINKYLANNILMKGKVEGKVADLDVEHLNLETAGIKLSTSGKISGLPVTDQLHAAIDLKEFSGTTKNLSKLLPEGSIPPNIAANESFNLKGQIKVNNTAYSFKLLMKSSSGNLALDGNVKQLKDADKLSYTIQAQSDGLLVDRILMDTLYGNTVFDIHLNGKGISPETAEAQVNAMVPVVHFKGYDYQNIDLSGQILNSVIDADLKINDTALNTKIVATYSLDSLNPLLKADAEMYNIDLQKLGFISDTLKFKGKLAADLTNVDSKHINGTILIPHIEITKGQDVFKLDSISLVAVNIDSIQNIAVKSPFLDMNLDGYYEMDVLPSVAQNLLIDYLTVYPPTGTVFKPVYAKLKGELRYHPIIPVFVPGFSFTKKIKFGSIVNTSEKDLMLAVAVPSAVYGGFDIDSTIFAIHTVHDTLQYALYTDGVRNSSFTLNHSLIEGNAKDGLINWDIKLSNQYDSLKYHLAGNVVNDTTKFVLHLNDDQIINAEKWNANPNNKTEYTKTGNIHTNLSLNCEKKQLSLQSATSEKGLPLDLKLIDFPITTITKIIASDTAMASGIINGTASIVSFDPLLFTSDLTIDSLKAYDVAIGNLSLDAHNEPGVGYSAHVNLTGSGNDVELNATYSDLGELKGKLGIREFNIQTLDPFLNSMLSDLKGSLNGDIGFEGTINNPVLNGELNVVGLQGKYKAYNTFFNIPEDKIILNSSGILLDGLKVLDSLENTANVNGQLHTTDYRNFSYDLSVKTDHFLALNKKSMPEQEYYGPAYFTSSLLISSAKDILTVKGAVKVDEKSVLNVEMGSVDTAVAVNNGIIIYVDSLQLADSAVASALKEELQKHAPSLKIGLAINLEMTKTSKLNIFLDKTGGDFMKVAGDANLTINQQPGGQMDMQGKFTIDNGEYQMTLSRIIKRKFIVEKGSSIQWNGSPTDAEIDLTALYNVETTAESILAGSQTSNKGAYKQTLPFEVYLILKKKLLQPAISFKLDMPEKEQNAFSGVVHARIKQINLDESELNKQVMGLLLLNQFIPQDPLSSGSGGGSLTLFDYESVARNTAGAIVSQQLNSLIGSRIKNVDVSFELDSKADYSTGDKTNSTDLTINLSRSLFNDRYTISVGSTIALEGSEEHKQNTSGLAGNYVAEYKITKDGRYRAKAYRKDQYEADNSGQVIQTGVALVLFLDFNKYREILRKQKDTPKK